MNGTNEILEELRSLSPSVAAISRRTPYEVPEGYFTGFPVLVLGRVAGWKGAKSLTYSVPEGYFDRFAQDVLARIKTGAAAGTLSPADVALAAGGEASDPVSPVLAQIGRVTPYQTPEGYFEELTPLLAVLKDKNPYAVPEGYFDSLSEVITARTGQMIGHEMREGKVVSLGSRARRSIGWLKYSAAAVVAGLIFTVGWLRWHQPAGETNNPNFNLATLSKVSDTELQNYLTDQDTTLAQPLSNTTATVDMNDTDLKTLLGDIPDGELKQYMEEHGGANDIATN
jgi:hypothetical protein